MCTCEVPTFNCRIHHLLGRKVCLSTVLLVHPDHGRFLSWAHLALICTAQSRHYTPGRQVTLRLAVARVVVSSRLFLLFFLFLSASTAFPSFQEVSHVDGYITPCNLYICILLRILHTILRRGWEGVRMQCRDEPTTWLGMQEPVG